MKEIIAIIRPNKMGRTKDVLDSLGFPSMTANRVLGRGKQKAILNEVTFEIKEANLLEEEGSMRYIPKRLISLVVPEEDASLVVEAMMKVNHTGQIGDGKIFVCPIEDAIRVRTKENGEKAIL
ncbi:MAG TPA: P-II family nitrogen regulator [Methanobacteriaceae archaeon]|nr:P-II family nitrogen regulator [Methanobacteriaceae archaeon]